MKVLRILFDRAMTDESFNSRLMFFLHGAVTSFGILVLTIAFVFAKNKEGYDMMVLALGGSGLAGAAGRFMTKKNSAGSEAKEAAEGESAALSG
jgi:hypothetical protein